MKPVSLFVSYARKDEEFRKELSVHLRSLERMGLITSWHDRLIRPGSDWTQAIDEHINQANIVLCLVSPDFIASDYCFQKEMTAALERRKSGLAEVIPILVRPAVWEQTPLAHLQSLPPGLLPISQQLDRDTAWKSVAEGILEVAQGIFGARRSLVDGLTKALDNVSDPRIVHPLVHEVSGLLDLMGTVYDEDAIDNSGWHDLTLLRLRAPQIAAAVEGYRREKARFAVWAPKAHAAVMRLLEVAPAVEAKLLVVTTLTAEASRRKLVLKLAEVDVLVAFDDANASSPGLRSLLVPSNFGFSRTIQVLNDEITSEMSQYASLLKAAQATRDVFISLVLKLAQLIRDT